MSRKLTAAERSSLAKQLEERRRVLRVELAAKLDAQDNPALLGLRNRMEETDDWAVADLETALDVAEVSRDAGELREVECGTPSAQGGDATANASTAGPTSRMHGCTPIRRHPVASPARKDSKRRNNAGRPRCKACTTAPSAAPACASASSPSVPGSPTATRSTRDSRVNAWRPRTTRAPTSSTTPRSTRRASPSASWASALKELNWRRSSYIVSTKLYWGLHDGPNEKNTLNRKYLMQAIDGSLARLQLDFVDLVFCHRADPHTPLEETVRAMSDMITAGKALYWGTSEWTAAEIAAAWHIADKHHLHKPVMEQPQYNILHRERVEKEYARLYADIGLGTTIWSPLASGLLTGKYNDGIPPDSRGTVKGYEWLQERLTDQGKLAKVRKLAPIAKDLGCTLAQMSLAWCLKNPHVSTVITGASRPSQVAENMRALDVVPKLTPDVMARIDEATG